MGTERGQDPVRREEDAVKLNGFLLKVLSGLVGAMFTVILIFIGYISSRFDKLENRIEAMQIQTAGDNVKIATLTQQMADLRSDFIEHVEHANQELSKLYAMKPDEIRVRVKNRH